MELKYKRRLLNSTNTIGDLTFPSNENNFLCNILELPVGEGDNYGQHGYAIAAGRYRILMLPSPKFDGMIVPHLQDVPDRSNILIHFGCFAKDTLGCLLTGIQRTAFFVNHSKDEFNLLLDILYRADDREEEIWITIED